jgi:hypothetical protein
MRKKRKRKMEKTNVHFSFPVAALCVCERAVVRERLLWNPVYKTAAIAASQFLKL